MKKNHPPSNPRPNRATRLEYFAIGRKFANYLAVVLLAMLGLIASSVQAQTTIKPFQIRVEVPTGFIGNLVLSNNVMKVLTNGAALDGTGTNWVIPNVNVSITGAPSGVIAKPTDSSGNLVTSVPITMNTNNASQSTNMFVNLAFDGTQVAGISTLSFNAIGAITNDNVLLTLEVGKIWNGAYNAAANGAGNWSSAAQWLGGSAPGASDSVVFTDVGMQTNSSYVVTGVSTNNLVNSVIDANTTISSLRFSSTNSVTNYANLYINPGVTLAIAGNGGFSMLRDYTYFSSSKLNVTIAGTGGTLIQTNENSSFSLLIDGQIASVLDMSTLGNLKLDVNQISVGDCFTYPNYLNLATNGYTSGSTIGGSRPNKVLPTWKMAMTNFVKAVYADPYNYTNASSRNYSVMIGRNDITGGSSANNFIMTMGISNVFNVDSICVAGYASLGSVLQFPTNNSYALFRGTNGGRMSMFASSDAAGMTYGSTSGANTKSAFNFPNNSTVDMLVDRFYLSRDRSPRIDSGNGDSQTAFGFANGIINANTAILGFQNEGSQTNASYCYATMTVSNTAVLQVNGNLALGYTTCSAGSVNAAGPDYGQLTIGPGGTVMASNITVGGVTKLSSQNKIMMLGNATLVVSNSIADATPNGALGTLSFAGGNNTLKLFVNGANPSALVYVTNLTATTPAQLVIGGVTNLTYPASVCIVQGAGIATVSASAFTGVTMPVGSGLTGTLITSNNAIYLQIINRTPNYLTWRGTPDGTGSADWDYTTKNWITSSGVLTNYDNPDVVAFDGAAGYATNINLAGSTPFTPTVINMTNSSVYYTIVNGPNQIIGGPTLNKWGSGTIEIDGNTTIAVQLNQGSLVGTSSGSIGNANIAAGTVMNYAGSLQGGLTVAGTATSAGSITGTLTVQSGGVVTNAGAINSPISVLNGGLLYNSGQLNNIGIGAAGSPTVASGGVLINSGSIGAAALGSVLYVNGTFEDLGGGSDNITVYSVSMGAGGVFMPGGTGIGTTVINSDGTGTFPGAALMVLGSTNVFNVNPTIPANTVLTADHLSFGGSASAQTQNGCTLVINNVSASPFSAGQTFQLFNNVYNTAIAPYSTGSSTNTYPVISPASPGTGLAWDLSQLWTSGSIGVVSASSGPSLTNSFYGDGTGTNIVGQFSWDSSKLGYRLQTLVTPITVGLATGTNYNWTGVSGSWTNTTITITNVIGTNCVFYRLVFP